MTEASLWQLTDERAKEPLHYTACGLDDVYLLSGYEIHDTAYGSGVSIKNLDGLHQAIGRHLVERKKLLNGKELRFLRTQMDLTQSEVGRLMGYSAQQVARWEKEQSEIPRAAERLLRFLYKEHLKDMIQVREVLEALDEMDAPMTDKQLFEQTQDGWRSAA